MVQRLQKILSDRGIASRRSAEEMISAGRVTCNGVVAQLGDSADGEKDIICLDGNQIPSGIKKVYIMLHKPRGYVTTLSDEKGRKTVAELVSACNMRVYPVGRLDMDSEGLLLLTNDGAFANSLMHPKHQVNKTYRVYVSGYTPEKLLRFQEPITLDGYTIAKPEVTVVHQSTDNPANAELIITIHEGRNRQVRRMCDIAGMRVSRLIRIQEGTLKLGSLSRGAWRYLTEAEISKLLNENKNNK